MAGSTDLAEAEPQAKLTWDEFNGLVKRAENGDKSSLSELRKALKSGAYPNWARWLRETHGNPASWLTGALARSAGGKRNLAVSEASEAKIGELRKELEGPSPTPLETLLAERAALCWFQVNHHETMLAQSTDWSIRQAEFQLRKIASAHNRFLSAVGTLARIRKMALPSVQVNIGANQINVV